MNMGIINFFSKFQFVILQSLSCFPFCRCFRSTPRKRRNSIAVLSSGYSDTQAETISQGNYTHHDNYTRTNRTKPEIHDSYIQKHACNCCTNSGDNNTHEENTRKCCCQGTSRINKHCNCCTSKQEEDSRSRDRKARGSHCRYYNKYKPKEASNTTQRCRNEDNGANFATNKYQKCCCARKQTNRQSIPTREATYSHQDSDNYDITEAEPNTIIICSNDILNKSYVSDTNSYHKYSCAGKQEDRLISDKKAKTSYASNCTNKLTKQREEVKHTASENNINNEGTYSPAMSESSRQASHNFTPTRPEPRNISKRSSVKDYYIPTGDAYNDYKPTRTQPNNIIKHDPKNDSMLTILAPDEDIRYAYSPTRLDPKEVNNHSNPKNYCNPISKSNGNTNNEFCRTREEPNNMNKHSEPKNDYSSQLYENTNKDNTTRLEPRDKHKYSDKNHYFPTILESNGDIFNNFSPTTLELKNINKNSSPKNNNNITPEPNGYIDNDRYPTRLDPENIKTRKPKLEYSPTTSELYGNTNKNYNPTMLESKDDNKHKNVKDYYFPTIQEFNCDIYDDFSPTSRESNKKVKYSDTKNYCRTIIEPEGNIEIEICHNPSLESKNINIDNSIEDNGSRMLENDTNTEDYNSNKLELNKNSRIYFEECIQTMPQPNENIHNYNRSINDCYNQTMSDENFWYSARKQTANKYRIIKHYPKCGKVCKPRPKCTMNRHCDSITILKNRQSNRHSGGIPRCVIEHLLEHNIRFQVVKICDKYLCL